MGRYRLERLNIDPALLPFEFNEGVDTQPLIERWTRLVERPPSECKPITDLYVWSVEVPRPPSIWDSFIRTVFDGTLDSDVRAWEKKGREIERKPKKAGFDDPEKALRLGQAIVAYTRNVRVARQYVSDLVESHIVMFVAQELLGELDGVD